MENKQISYKHFRNNRRFGTELEFGKTVSKSKVVKTIQEFSNYKVKSIGHVASRGNNLWHVKTDCTCGADGYGGWEVASFVGKNHRDIIHIGGAAKALKDSGAEVNRNCGLHVHVEIADFEKRDIGVLLACWLKIEKIMRLAVSKKRYLDYCRLIKLETDWKWLGHYYGKYYSPQDLYDLYMPNNRDDVDEFRYRAINIVNYYKGLRNKSYKRKTVEYRLPEGTLEENDVVNWLRLYVNFTGTVKTAQMPSNIEDASIEEAMGYLGLYHENDKFYIFSSALNKTRIWFLKRIINRLDLTKKLSYYNNQLRTDAKKLLKEIS
jgi:hypothetical protein